MALGNNHLAAVRALGVLIEAATPSGVTMQQHAIGMDTFVWRGYKTKSREGIEKMEMLALRREVKEEKHLELYRALREDIGMKTYLHGPMDYAKKLKLRFRVDLDLPERRKRYTSSREEEDVATNMFPCGTTMESRTHIVGECETYKEEWVALEEEMGQFDACDVEEFGRLEISEKTMSYPRRYMVAANGETDGG